MQAERQGRKSPTTFPVLCLAEEDWSENHISKKNSLPGEQKSVICLKRISETCSQVGHILGDLSFMGQALVPRPGHSLSRSSHGQVQCHRYKGPEGVSLNHPAGASRSAAQAPLCITKTRAQDPHPRQMLLSTDSEGQVFGFSSIWLQERHRNNFSWHKPISHRARNAAKHPLCFPWQVFLYPTTKPPLTPLCPS